MSNSKDRNLFQQLSTLFKSGSVVKRKIRSFDTAMATPDKVKSSGVLLFQKSLSPTYATITSNAYNLSERLMRMQDFCLSGDTLIATPDEKGSKRIDEIVEAWNNGEREQLVFSYDHETKMIVAAKVTGAKFIGNKEVVKVILDDGSEIVCTPEHRFMLRDGSYAEAGDLCGKELMPFSLGTCHFSRNNIFCVRIEELSIVIPVYDIEVAKYNNFAIAHDSPGLGIHGVIFVHNCEMEQCLSGDTLIATSEGFKRLDELAEENKVELNKTFIVYSYDHNERKIVPALAKQARYTVDEKAYKITFESGKTITGCEDHRLMLADGTYCKIKDIHVGMLMMQYVRPNFCDEVKFNARREDFVNQVIDRTDVTFGKILRTAERVGVDLKQLSIALDVSNNKILNIIDQFGYKSFETFAHAYSNIENHCYLIDREGNLISEQFELVKNVEYVGILPLYDLTVDGYKNFATDSVISHNTPEIASTLDIVADETCLSGNSIIPLLDGSRPTILELFQSGRSNFWVYSYDTKTMRIVPGLVTSRIVKTGTKRLFKVELDDGTSLRLTGNHRVLLSDGTYSEVSTLNVGSSLKSLYIKISDREFGDRIHKNWGDYVSRTNHRVISIIEEQEEDVFDLEVEQWHNFATTASPKSTSFVFVHNCSVDDKGRALHVYSDNPKIKETLEELFYDTLNVEFSLRSTVRNVIKYGDGFNYIDVHPNYGVVGSFPVPVNEIEREENYDRNDPFATRFRWVSMGNRTLENWEIAHFRLMGNDQFLPYGCSWIEPARKIWRQLMLLEDAMLVYRVSRAPERRVFYVDVGNLPANEVEAYMQQQKQALRTNSVVDKDTGRIDLRYSPLSIDEDYVIPTRGGESATKIETLAGLQNQGNVEDVAYLQKKLFAALKIPAAYLGYGDALGSKASLAQLDVRFSRSIASIQRIIIAELNKIAVIHLFAHGFKGDDLQNFVLRLSNPSTVAQQQKLELWRAKFEIAGSAPEGIASRNFIRREILMLNNEQIETLDEERYDEKLVDAAIDNAGAGEQVVADTGGESDEDLFGGGSEKEGAPEKEEKPKAGAEKEEKPENAGTLPDDDLQLLTSSDIDEDDDFVNKAMLELDSALPIKPNGHLQKALYNNQRQRHNGASSTYSPEVDRMAKTGDLLNDPYDKNFFRELATEGKNATKRIKLTSTLRKTLSDMANSKRFIEANFDAGTEKRVLAEGIDVQDEIDELNANNELDIDIDVVL